MKKIIKKEAKELGSFGLIKGDVVRLKVILDNKNRPVFKASVHNLDAKGNENPSIRIVHLSCTSSVTLTKDEIWQGIVSDIFLSKKTMPVLSKERRVIYVYTGQLQRLEEVKITFHSGAIHREISSGRRLISRQSIPATIRMHKVVDNGHIRSVGEVTVAGRIVMRTDGGLVDERDFTAEQTAMLHRPFDLAAAKKRLPALTPGQHSKLGRLYVTWGSLEILRESELEAVRLKLATAFAGRHDGRKHQASCIAA